MKKIGFVLILIILFAPATAYAKRGCCSHHGGVSGCSSSGRQICNDGTLSPTCTCTPRVTYIYGCMDKTARNYNSKANIDDGSCRFDDNYDSKKSVNYTSSKRDKLIAIGVIINIIYFFIYLFMKKDKI